MLFSTHIMGLAIFKHSGIIAVIHFCIGSLVKNMSYFRTILDLQALAE
jgi:hypothetical protein